MRNNKINKQKEIVDLCFKLARIIRNTDALGPATSGHELAQLLVQLRLLDGERYTREIMEPKKIIVS